MNECYLTWRSGDVHLFQILAFENPDSKFSRCWHVTKWEAHVPEILNRDSWLMMNCLGNPGRTWSSTFSDWMSFHSSIVWARSTMHRGTFTSPIWVRNVVMRKTFGNWGYQLCKILWVGDTDQMNEVQFPFHEGSVAVWLWHVVNEAYTWSCLENLS